MSMLLAAVAPTTFPSVLSFVAAKESDAVATLFMRLLCACIHTFIKKNLLPIPLARRALCVSCLGKTGAASGEVSDIYDIHDTFTP